MKFYVSNPLLDKQINDIRRKIRLSMNGVVSEEMALRGAAYKQNYGVSVLRLREIARMYPKNHDLAQRLWILGIRETMILATLLEPEDRCTPEEALKWTDDFNQVELVEQACMNLFSKIPRAVELSLRLLDADELWKLITGFTLSARIYQQFSDEDVRRITAKGMELSAVENTFLYHSIALSLSYLCRRTAETARFIQSEIDRLEASELPGQRYIWHEVEGEISFLNF